MVVGMVTATTFLLLSTFMNSLGVQNISALDDNGVIKGICAGGIDVKCKIKIAGQDKIKERGIPVVVEYEEADEFIN